MSSHIQQNSEALETQTTSVSDLNHTSPFDENHNSEGNSFDQNILIISLFYRIQYKISMSQSVLMRIVSLGVCILEPSVMSGEISEGVSGISNEDNHKSSSNNNHKSKKLLYQPPPDDDESWSEVNLLVFTEWNQNAFCYLIIIQCGCVRLCDSHCEIVSS